MTNEELVILIQQGSNTKEYMTELYNQNKALLAKICRKYANYAEVEDLMQESYFGLCNAAAAWDPSKGTAFSTLAYYHVVSAVQHYIEDYSAVVRIPSHLRADIIKLKRVQDDYYKTHGKHPTTADLARAMRLPESKIMSILNGVLASEPTSIDNPISEDGLCIGDTLRDPRNGIEAVEKAIERQQLQSLLWGIIDGLEPDQSRLLHEKYEHGLTEAQTAERMGTTPGKCKNIEAKAMRVLRTAHNKKRLLEFYTPNDRAYSIGLRYSSFHYFMNTWTSAPERAALLAEQRQRS